jgi:hypothetical protein
VGNGEPTLPLRIAGKIEGDAIHTDPVEGGLVAVGVNRLAEDLVSGFAEGYRCYAPVQLLIEDKPQGGGGVYHSGKVRSGAIRRCIP